MDIIKMNFVGPIIRKQKQNVLPKLTDLLDKYN